MRYALIAILTSLIISCKKSYNCRCTTTVSSPGSGQGLYRSETKPVSEKLSKTQAQAVCDHEATNISTTYNNVFTNNGTQSSNGAVATTKCEVED